MKELGSYHFFFLGNLETPSSCNLIEGLALIYFCFLELEQQQMQLEMEINIKYTILIYYKSQCKFI